MPDLPLIGGHAPGTSAKAFSETAVNVFIESRGKVGIMRNRPGYERYDRYGVTPNAPTDAAHTIDSIDLVGDVITVQGGTTNVRYGYEVGDTITISAATNTDYNQTWTAVTVAADQESWTCAASAGTPVPSVTEGATSATCTDSSTYKKEIRLMQRYDQGSGAVVVRAVIGNRVYNWSHISAAWIEETAETTRFISLHGPVAGDQMGDTLLDGVILSDGVSAAMEGVTAKTLSKTGAQWEADTLLIKSNTVTFIDGYLIRDNRAATGQFIYSDIFLASTENPFNFATAEGAPDDLIAVLGDRRELWLFGESTTEIWYNVGDKDLPFQRSQGGFIETGIAAPLTAKRFDNSVAWLAQDRRGGLTVVRAGEGYQPQMISTEAINVQLNAAKEYLFNAFANVIRWEGHEFYVLTIPGNYGFETAAGGFQDSPTPITLAYDSNSKEWFKWASHDDLLATADHGRWFVTAHVNVYDSDNREMAANTSKSFGNHHMIAGRDGSGEFYMMKTTSHVDEHASGSQVIQCERTMPPVQGPDYRRINAGPMELITDHDAGELATATLSYAKDSKTFGSTLSRTLTATSSRFLWKRIGRAYRWIFRITQDTTATLPVRWLRLTSRKLGETNESGLQQ